MNTHYIPRLLLRQFATGERVNSYDYKTDSFQSKKMKHTFAEQDLFDTELEKAFARKVEGPVGNLLNNKLLKEKRIFIDRKENMLLRKFLMINFLRAPIINTTWDEMVERTQTQEHPSVQAKAFIKRHHPELNEFLEKGIPSEKTYISDLKQAMEIDFLEEMANPNNRLVSPTLNSAAIHAMVTVIAFWDSEGCGQEFILPKLPGISQMDQRGLFYKSLVLKNTRNEKEKDGLKEEFRMLFDRLQYGTIVYPENYSLYPLSPTRMLVCFAPYFRMFFPTLDITGTMEVYPPLLGQEQFDRHFFEPMRMELFEPCKNVFQDYYHYEVKELNAEEVMSINSLLLDMETEEFVFHDFSKIRDSFWYYDQRACFAFGKKHDFSHIV